MQQTSIPRQGKGRRWLLAIDGSLEADRTAEYVARWAPALGVVDVYVLNVQPLGSYRAYALNRSETLLEAETHGAQVTALARKILDDARVPHRLHTEIWDPADSIVGAAREQKVDEMLLGTRGMGALANLVLGSVAYKVIHLAEVPVTVVGNPHRELHLSEGFSAGAHRVLLSVDGSDHAMRAVDYVCRLRDAHVPVEVHLVNVQLPIVSGKVRRFVSDEMIDAQYREEGEAALRTATVSLRRSGIQFESHIMAGHLAETIVHSAEDHRCTRIVMGTRGRGAVANVLFGSVAYKVLHLAPMPVTLVK